jgi:hypothetical protein
MAHWYAAYHGKTARLESASRSVLPVLDHDLEINHLDVVVENTEVKPPDRRLWPIHGRYRPYR